MIRLASLSSVFVLCACGAPEREPVRAPEPPATPSDAPDAAAEPPVVEAPNDAAPPPTTAITDANGCVVDLVAHAAGVALTAIGKELEESLGRPATASDLTGASCSRTGELPDLDGDGKADFDVSLCSPPGGHVWQHYLYVSNKGCTRYGDRLVDAELEAKTTSHSGMKDLESTAANGCAGHDFTWTRWAWNGKGYEVADTATCYFCSDSGAPKPPAGANRHAHCREEKARRKAATPQP